MADLRQRFRVLDRVAVPDLWSEIERLADVADVAETPQARLTGRPVWRGAAPHPTESSWWPRLVLAAMVAAVALALLALIIGRPQPKPLPPSAPLVFQGSSNSTEGVFAVAPDGGEPKLIFESLGQRIHLSPDGRYAFFGAADGVVLARTDGSSSRVLSDPGMAEVGREFERVWAPDSHAVAWISWHDNRPSLMVAQAEPGTADERPLEIAMGPGSDPHVVWSPDSIHLAWVEWGACETAGSKGLAIVDSTTGASVEVGDQLDVNGMPAFSHDGRHLVVTVATGAVAPAETPEPNQVVCATRDGPPGLVIAEVASGAISATVANATAYNIAWSADDTAFRWPADPDGDGLRIWSASREGGEPQAIATVTAFDAVWSPDGSMLAWWEFDADAPETGSLMVMDLADLAPRLVARDVVHSGAVVWPKWSPDGQWLAFTRGPLDPQVGGRGGSIWIVRPDGTGERELVPYEYGLNLSDVDW